MLIQFIPCSHACTFNSEGGSIGPLLPKMSWSILFLWLNEPHMHQNTSVLQTYYTTCCFCGSVQQSTEKTAKMSCYILLLLLNEPHMQQNPPKKKRRAANFLPASASSSRYLKTTLPCSLSASNRNHSIQAQSDTCCNPEVFFQPHLSGNGALGISFFWLLWSGLGAGS